MLYTNLKHIESGTQLIQIVHEKENVVVVCGRMDTKSIPVYRIAEELENEYSHVKFFDLEFDNPESQVIRNMPEVNGFTEIPIILYYRKGQTVRATSGIQTKEQIINIIDHELAITVSI
jgi:thioredoxin 1